MQNKVYLVGAGPGKADLITVRGLNILREADVVIYDYLVDKRILQNAKEGAELICCDTLGKKRYSDARLRPPQADFGEASAKVRQDLWRTTADGFLIHNEKINNLVIKKVKEGKKVIRLKNGDPSIFSRTSQELEPLIKNKIDFEIVPGVTAASAASAFSGIPLTDRRVSSSCVFITGHEDPAKKTSSIDWKSLSKVSTIVLYMAVENLQKIVKNLIDSGKSIDTPVAIIQNVSLPSQKILKGNLKDIVAKAKKQSLMPPAIIIIGKVVNFEKKFNWLSKSIKILFTGLSSERFFINERFFHLPLIKIEPLKNYKEFDSHLKNINGEHGQTIDWIVFASRFGVHYFFERLKKLRQDLRILNGIKIAAIGNSTANRLLDFGIIADLVPQKESAEGLIERFKRIDLKNKKIFLPRSDIADKGLTKELEDLGAKVISGFAYRNVMPENLPDLDWNFFNEIMFTSPSTVRNFIKRYGKIPKKIKIRCIGSVTAREAKRWSLI